MPPVAGVGGASSQPLQAPPSNQPVRGTTNAGAQDTPPPASVKSAQTSPPVQSLRAAETGKGNIIDAVG